MTERKLFCEYGPVFYKIFVAKECGRRYIKDMFSANKFAVQAKNGKELDIIVKSHASLLCRPLHGVDMSLQENKVRNLEIAAASINGVVIKPGETFSFWKAVGKPSAKAGFLPGLTISGAKMTSDVGGGLCQLANMVHWLVLHSPMEVTELHHHSDALFPDAGRRVPFGTGTSIFYNNVDYRFKNITNNNYQLKIWLDEDNLLGEIRSDTPMMKRYKIIEQDSYFSMENGVYFRNSKVYRLVYNKISGELDAKELILDNHSKVMYDPALIPKDQIR